MRTAFAGARLGVLILATVAALVVPSCSSDPIVQKLAIGSTCDESSECGSEPPFVCEIDRPGGYCTKVCESDADCPSEAICVLSGGSGQCRNLCPAATACRTPYTCHAASPTGPTVVASKNYCN